MTAIASFHHHRAIALRAKRLGQAWLPAFGRILISSAVHSVEKIGSLTLAFGICSSRRSKSAKRTESASVIPMLDTCGINFWQLQALSKMPPHYCIWIFPCLLPTLKVDTECITAWYFEHGAVWTDSHPLLQSAVLSVPRVLHSFCHYSSQLYGSRQCSQMIVPGEAGETFHSWLW